MRGSKECSAEMKIASCIDFVDATVMVIEQQQYQSQHSADVELEPSNTHDFQR